MKIGIFQDIHANLPAFKKGIEVFRDHYCSKIYHVGDLIGIGPYPREVIELALATAEIELIMGNHDYWYAYGLPMPIPAYMTQNEVDHHQWVHSQIGKGYKDVLKQWSFINQIELTRGRGITFQHYGLDQQTNWFKPFIQNPRSEDLDQMFDGANSDIIFYGHKHEPSDIIGNSRYVNLGSAGCHHKSEVRLGILNITEEHLELAKLSIPYHDDGLIEAFETRQVPARDYIIQQFIKR